MSSMRHHGQSTFSHQQRAGWAAAVLVAVAVAAAASPPEPAALSKVAPADDLVAVAEGYLKSLGEGLGDDAAFAASAEKRKQTAHALVAVAQALGLHDSDHRLKAAAPAMVEAARQLAAAKELDVARQNYAALEAAARGKPGAAPPLEWKKLASMGQLMQEVTQVNTALRRNMRRFEQRADDNARAAAFLAAAAQVILYDTHEVKNPADLDKWYELCARMRDAAGDLNAQIRGRNEGGAKEALERLSQSCDDCHEVFQQ